MANRSEKMYRKLFSILVLMIVLQAVCIGFVIRFASDSLGRDTELLQKSRTMLDDIFPGISSGISEVSSKADMVYGEVSGLRSQVAKIDNNVNQLGEGVGSVGKQVQTLGDSFLGFVTQKSGLIWGHSLNPYLLLVLLIAAIASIPLWLAFSTGLSAKRAKFMETELLNSLGDVKRRLEQLSQEFAKFSQSDAARPVPSFEQLISETEILLVETRNELERLRRNDGPSEASSPKEFKIFH
jgi:hypothetical protein